MKNKFGPGTNKLHARIGNMVGYSCNAKRFLVPCAAAVLFMLGDSSARANTIIVNAVLGISSSAASPGSSGTIEVSLKNTGTSTLQIASFAMEISTANTYLSFTDATIDTTDAYIFAGDSLFADLTTGSIAIQTAPTLIASDESYVFSLTGTPTSVLAGATVGLGKISFSIAPDAPSAQALIDFVDLGGGTSLSDAVGNILAPDNIEDGTVPGFGTVTIAPEPSSIILLSGGVLLLWKRVAKARG